MNLLSSADLNWGIGYNGQLLFHTKKDMQRVKELTTGNVIVMGRKTFLSLPKQKPLPNRKNIVLSSAADFCCEGVTVCHSMEALFLELAQYPPEAVFVFGGQSLYEQLLPYCRHAYITQYFAEKPHDAALPRIDQSPDWRLKSSSAMLEENSLQFRFDLYERIANGASLR